ncbi:phosphoribosylformylglycinamidine synthase [Guyparkeria hydrothermalis]|uniref:phosphoribosylformylglycinamidine synthase n=1 Tax=Guyparkeria hydrothermalis TaxID=923 RepID=UPI002021C12D|nr:phosphoribosylformylglycinamidine synthase [Guyparkeria hydrothermalis]MCL7743993.1 phosphoribosylformylglycinamidine synthase [Guyparkeria hydrothermalis]
MRIITGNAARSPFRLAKLAERLRDLHPGIEAVHARFVHLLDLNDEKSVDQDRLEELLDYGESVDAWSDDWPQVIVAPRAGTISPWSSKATDIARICGLEGVSRIERGIEFAVSGTGIDADGFEWSRELLEVLHDRMTESVYRDAASLESLFVHAEPAPLGRIALGDDAHAAIAHANGEMGLALSEDEIAYLAEQYQHLGRDPSDVELMMFAQANSEHCRHKIFNADWTIDGEDHDLSLFAMIRNTHRRHPEGTLSAYKDNAAVLEGQDGTRFAVNPATGRYETVDERIDFLAKVETHNHPTAISPDPGAATGAGGEIRDEGATGRGGKPKAGLTGFSVSNLRIPELPQPWEHATADLGRPDRIVSPLEIMLEGPIGAASFNNEFGRPALGGYFRTLEMNTGETDADGNRRAWGYHKPIMIAGGVGVIRPNLIEKEPIAPGHLLIVLGGPAMQIGLGGGAASSQDSGSGSAELDFASVQRANPEMERRVQEVIDRCISLGDTNPIVSAHDVGAGGLSNALPELINDAGMGGTFDLRKIPNDEPGMSPLAIWCNESQERYVLAIQPGDLERFAALCDRERAPFAVVGTATAEQHLRVEDPHFGNNPVDLPMQTLFGHPPKMHRDVARRAHPAIEFEADGVEINAALDRVLALPGVGDKSFLITIGDRSVGGLVARDQMVGPAQVPVADSAVTATDFYHHHGEAMAMGERAPVALLDAPASARLAVAEVVTNLAGTAIDGTDRIKLSANWMAACGHDGEDARLFDTVRTVGMEFCPALGISIPVGKDSLSMKTRWQDDDTEKSVTSPVSLVVTGFAPVSDVRRTLTPELVSDTDNRLLLVDLGLGQNRLGGSALAQVYNATGATTPDIAAAPLKAFFDVVQELNRLGYLTAYHDRSDGGAITALLEMAFAGRCGLDLEIEGLGGDALAGLFAEEVGAVIQVRTGDLDVVREQFAAAGIGDALVELGRATTDRQVHVDWRGKTLIDRPLAELKRIWSATSFHMSALRDNPETAEQAYHAATDFDDPQLAGSHASFEVSESVAAPMIATGKRPRIAILREQGVNGEVEMAAAFTAAGFEAVDVHMADLIGGQHDLTDMKGLVACGGFSFGDVLGAGSGWAHAIRYNARASDAMQAFFERDDTFGLGVCNGCQMFSQLADLIPGASHWPRFLRNRSEQFEARLSLVEIPQSPSVLLAGMAGSRLPITVAHGEGRVAYRRPEDANAAFTAMRYVDGHGVATETYPANPNGSAAGETGFTTEDGRFTIMMPHPERVWRASQFSWKPERWSDEQRDSTTDRGPWLRLFENARVWVDG